MHVSSVGIRSEIDPPWAFYNMDVSSVGIWSEIDPPWMPEKQTRVFLEQLGKALVTPHIQSTAAQAALVKAVQGTESGPDPPEAAAVTGKRRRCQFCNSFMFFLFFFYLCNIYVIY